MDFLYFISIFLFVYPFFIYPIILKLLKLFISDKNIVDANHEKAELPLVSIIISVYNEEDYIYDCLQSIVDSDYPIEKLNVLIGSDGSDDGTDRIVQSFEEKHANFRLFRFDRGGKNNVLNNLIGYADSEIVFFMDADTRLRDETLKHSVLKFEDESIGVVLVKIKSRNLTGEIDESSYQAFEEKIRKLESDIKSTINSTGPFYAIRKEVYHDLSDNRICDDYAPVLKSITEVKKVKFYPDIIADEFRDKNIVDEQNRRKRVSAGGLATIFTFPQLLSPFKLTGFFLLSHKILRYLMPYTYILAMISSALLSVFLGGIWSVVLLFTALPLILHVLNLITAKKLSRLKIFQYSEFLLVMLYGIHLGWIAFLKGRNNAIWTH